MVRTTSATGAGGVAGMSLDSAELESKADVDEPVEYREADDDPKLQVSKESDPEEVFEERCVGGEMAAPRARILRCICLSMRSTHPQPMASSSLRKNVSIATTSARIAASDGRSSGLVEKILRRSRYAVCEMGSVSKSTVRSIK